MSFKNPVPPQQRSRGGKEDHATNLWISDPRPSRVPSFLFRAVLTDVTSLQRTKHAPANCECQSRLLQEESFFSANWVRAIGRKSGDLCGSSGGGSPLSAVAVDWPLESPL
jgi:hypothetical protein